MVEWVAKIVPIPLGATFDDVKQFLKEMKWNVRLLKTVGSQAWLIEAPSKFDDHVGSWNDQVLLVHWLPKKGSQNTKIILASQSNKSSFVPMNSADKDIQNGDTTHDAWAT